MVCAYDLERQLKIIAILSALIIVIVSCMFCNSLLDGETIPAEDAVWYDVVLSIEGEGNFTVYLPLSAGEGPPQINFEQNLTVAGNNTNASVKDTVHGYALNITGTSNSTSTNLSIQSKFNMSTRYIPSLSMANNTSYLTYENDTCWCYTNATEGIQLIKIKLCLTIGDGFNDRYKERMISNYISINENLKPSGWEIVKGVKGIIVVNGKHPSLSFLIRSILYWPTNPLCWAELILIIFSVILVAMLLDLLYEKIRRGYSINYTRKDLPSGLIFFIIFLIIFLNQLGNLFNPFLVIFAAEHNCVVVFVS